MKKLLAILIVLSAMLMNQPDYISIEHIGIGDKPISTIVISKEKIVIPGADNFIVKNADYVTLKSLILSSSNVDYKGNEFGSFKIRVKNAIGKDIYHCLNRQKSIELLNKLIKTCEKKENIKNELLARLELMKKRILF